MELLGLGEISAGGTGGAVGLGEVLTVLTCVAVARHKLGEAAHLWVSELFEPWLGVKNKGGQVRFTALFYRA